MKKGQQPDLDKIRAKRNMPKKWRKVNDEWVEWQQPEPVYPSTLTNHMRMEIRRIGREKKIDKDGA